MALKPLCKVKESLLLLRSLRNTMTTSMVAMSFHNSYVDVVLMCEKQSVLCCGVLHEIDA